MSEQVRIEFATHEGAVLRLIGLVERRGFRAVQIAMSEDAGGATASMMLDLAPRDATRRIEILIPQIRRIHGVTAVTTFDLSQASAA